ncbi:hypothetical protein DFR24_1715 [Panacagrimonas perspica]|uniref:Copper resistance protein C n=1 Tax=Panacagrimonas perspica TaxID=381431 RepID=A0A4S3KAE3_9GAMM|nr:hypothetical protein DFR24_1715 [Panacagrimonas perspica]THD05259.1 hypothetical protein B1810_00460 [Panacagrimonas perspica]
MHRRTSALLRLLATVALFAASLGTAWAHAALTKSSPGNREVLAKSPANIHLQFNEKVEAKFSTVSIEDAKGQKLALPAPTASPDDAYGLDVAVPAILADGRYTVKYRVLSQDGHVIERSFAFTLKTATSESAAPTTP